MQPLLIKWTLSFNSSGSRTSIDGLELLAFGQEEEFM